MSTLSYGQLLTRLGIEKFRQADRQIETWTKRQGERTNNMCRNTHTVSHPGLHLQTSSVYSKRHAH